MNFRNLCERKTIYIGEGELIVGERGPRPKAVSSFPELTCHSEDDLRILDSRPMTSYRVSREDLAAYREKVIPYWRGRSMRDRAFAETSRGLEGPLRGRALHRVHGAARSWPYRPRRLDLPQGHERAPRRDSGREGRDRLGLRRRGPRQGRGAQGDGHRLRGRDRSSRGAMPRLPRTQMAAAESRAARAPPSCGAIAEVCERVRRGGAARLSGRPCRPIGSSTSARSPSSTAGTR